MAAVASTTPAATPAAGNTVGAGVGLVAGAAVGYGIAHVAKLTGKKHWTILLVAGLAAAGAYVGYQQ